MFISRKQFVDYFCTWFYRKLAKTLPEEESEEEMIKQSIKIIQDHASDIRKAINGDLDR